MNVVGEPGSGVQRLWSEPVVVAGCQQDRHLHSVERVGDETDSVGCEAIVLVQVPGADQRIDLLLGRHGDDVLQHGAQCEAALPTELRTSPGERAVQVQIREVKQAHWDPPVVVPA